MLKSSNYNDSFRKFKDTDTDRTYLAWFVYDAKLADVGMCILFVENFISGTSKGYEVDVPFPGYLGIDKIRRYRFFNEWKSTMEEHVEKFIKEIEKPIPVINLK